MIKKLKKFAVNNLLAVLIIVTVSAVLITAALKLIFSKPMYAYAKVRVSQGLWWANTSRPQLWMVQPLKKGMEETDLLGRPKAELLSFTYYPWQQLPSIQYDTYLNLKLRVSKNGKTGGYKYDRNTIGVGSAIDLEFPTVSLSGTVMELSPQPINESYEVKTVYLSKLNAREWEYDAIKAGDAYFDGQDTALKVLDKSSENVNYLDLDASFETSVPPIEPRVNVSIKTRMKVKKAGDYYLFGEEQQLAVGKEIFVALPSVILPSYKVTKIE